MTSPRRLHLERLEDRDCPATYFVGWPDARHLTLSFAPDGADAGGAPSSLYQSLDMLQPQAVWQNTLLRAFQAWTDVADVNLTVVPDGGQPFGSPGAIQGDPRFGDIRIGTRPLAPTDLAMTAPPDLGDTWAGDVIFNSNLIGVLSPIQLYNIALHEAGHALGLPESSDPLSVMYTTYLGQNLTILSASDIRNIQDIYGPRPPDALEGAHGDDAFPTAAVVPFGPAFDADLSTPSDVDYYKVVASSAGSFDVALRTSGLSLTAAQLSVYDGNQDLIATASASDPLNGNLDLPVPGAAAGATYYVKVQGANPDVFGVGAYRLAIGPSAAAFLATTPTAPVWQPGDANATPATATVLPLTYAYGDDHVDHSVRAQLADSTDVNYYRLTAPQAASATEALLAVAYGQGSNALSPLVAIYDASGNALPLQVVHNDAGGNVVEALNVTPGATYFAAVSAGPQGAGTGVYQLSLDFRPPLPATTTVASGQLSLWQPATTSTLVVTQTRLYSFNLTATAGASSQPVRVDATISALLGGQVLHLLARNGQAGAGEVWLSPGVYVVNIRASSGGPLPQVQYSLTDVMRDDPDGVDPTDTTYMPSSPSSPSDPSQQNNAPPPQTTYYPPPQSPDGGTTYGGDPSGSGSPPPDDPYGQPYWQ
jgi:hypothetical protein